MDIFNKIKKGLGPIGDYKEKAEGYYVFPKLTGPIGNRMYFQDKEVICWSVNDYLGLANHPEVRKTDAQTAADYGLAYPMGARMMSGHSDAHETLERDFAKYLEKEAAFVVNFGYQGIVSAIDCLVDKNDVIVYDKDCHACIIDGVRLHFGKRFSFIHNDMESFEKNLARAKRIVDETGGGILVISEGVFGMRGEQGKLKEIAALKSKYPFRLFVDDAHGFGTLGEGGRGAGVEQGIQDDIDVYFATFAKSFAAVGAVFAGDQDMIDFLRYNMRSQMFAKSLPMTYVLGVQKRLELIKENPSYKENLWNNVRMLQSGLKERGFDIGKTSSCVTPVYLKGTPDNAMPLVYDLRENFGIFCSIVVYPVIPKGMLLLRLIPTARHTKEDIDITLEAFSEIRKRLEAGKYDVPATVA